MKDSNVIDAIIAGFLFTFIIYAVVKTINFFIGGAE